MSDDRLTQEEFRELFGDRLPIEAVKFVFQDAPAWMPMSEVRARLREMAAKHRSKQPCEMIERVARAIAADRAEPFDSMNGEERDSWIETARAAIEAMREPTEAMKQAGYLVTVDDEIEVWQTMIDEALK